MRTFIITLCIILFLAPFCFADDILDEELENFEFYEASTVSNEEPITNSKHIIVIDRETLSVLYEKDAYTKTAMASTTKIMTCLLAIENISLDTQVTVSQNAAKIHGSNLGLHTNDKLTVNDLLYGLMLRSGNDCAIAIAEAISGSTEKFAILMNTKAKELNLENTNFVTPNGLDDINHYTTAYDLALLTNHALKNETFRKIVSTKTCSININNSYRVISNTNELLGNTDGVYGVKTGFTFNAGRCLVSSCKRGTMDIIIVVLGANTKKIRTTDSLNLINYVFKNFSYIDVSQTLQDGFENYLRYNSNNFILEKTSTIPALALEKNSNLKFPLKTNGDIKFNTKIHIINNLSFKTPKGSVVGTIDLYNNDFFLCSSNIILQNDLIINDWKYYWNNIFKNLF